MDEKGTTLECAVTSQAGSLFANYFGKCYKVLSLRIAFKIIINYACMFEVQCAHTCCDVPLVVRKHP